MQTRARTLLVLLASLTPLAAACGDSSSTDAGPDTGTADGGTDAGPTDLGTDGGTDGGAWARPECEGLNPESCLLPWPSARYLVDDATTMTHRRVDIPREAMPANTAGTHIDPAEFNRWNGFTGQTSFMTVHAGMIDPSNLADWQHIDQSLLATSPTVLLDVTDLAHPVEVAHWAELDMHPDVPPALRPLYVRPASRLTENHHFVVAIRNLQLMGGGTVEPYDNFKALRDNTPGPAYIESRRARFESDVFAPLTAAGIDRASLIEAWDIWTATDDQAYQDLIDARDSALTIVGSTGLGCHVDTTEEPDVATDTHIFRKVRGTVTVPLFSMTDEPGAPLRRDAMGKPMAMGTTEVPFTLEIPRSVATSVGAGGAPVRLIQYGHGLFGGRDEVEGGYMTQFIDDYPSVAVASDWVGMSDADVTYAATVALPDISNFAPFVDRQIQGLVNFLVVVRTLKGVCADDPAFQVSGHPSFDPAKVYYHGNSQGGIFGMTYAGISTDIDHFGIGVGAASYGIFMPRSIDWKTYELIVQAWYRRPIDRYLILAMLSQAWERTDPAVFTAHTLDHVLPRSPAGKRILMQVGRWDAQVNNVGSDLAARNYGLPYYSPSTYAEYGLTPFTDVSDSGYVMYDTGAGPVPDTATYASGDEPQNAHGQTVHEAVRRDPRAQMQLDAFLQPGGQVHNFCGAGAACDPLP